MHRCIIHAIVYRTVLDLRAIEVRAVESSPGAQINDSGVLFVHEIYPGRCGYCGYLGHDDSDWRRHHGQGACCGVSNPNTHRCCTRVLLGATSLSSAVTVMCEVLYRFILYGDLHIHIECPCMPTMI